METFSLVKINSDRVSNLMQNKYNKRVTCRSVVPNHKNVNMGSSTIHLHRRRVDMIDMQIKD